MKILVTGCAGFIGYHVVRRFVSAGHEVVGVDNLNDYYDTQLKLDRLAQSGVDPDNIVYGVACRGMDGFTFIRASVEDNSLYTLLESTSLDSVCHLAAQAGVRHSIDNPRQYIISNIEGFFNILELCRRKPSMRLVFASSSSVYGRNTSMPCRENDVTDSPVSLYAATKKAGELMAHAYTELYGFEAVGLRFFTVYGPWGRPDMAPFIFIKAILGGSPVRLFNNGDMERDFTYVDDIAEGVLRVLLGEPATEESCSRKFRVYNIGNSHPVGLEGFVSEIEKAAGCRAERLYLPMQPGDVQRTWADTTRLREDYGYIPSTTPTQGVRAFVNWYKSYYNI